MKSCLPVDHEYARPFYGGITYIFNSYNIIILQVINIMNFPLSITSSRTYSLNPGLYPATIRSQATPGLFERSPKPGYSRTIRQLSDAGPLPDCSATIRSRVSPGLFGHYTKLDFSQTVRPLSEAGLLQDYPATLRRRGFPHSRDCTRPFYEGTNISIYIILTILTYGKTKSLSAHTPLRLIPTHMTHSEHAYGYISSY